MEFVRVRMGHSSLATTERYLTYRSRLDLARAVQDGWEARLEMLARQAMNRK
jgi:integrase